MKLSIVTTLYKSKDYIQEFYERISAQAKQITDDYEIIFVNDGSPDNSNEIAIQLSEVDTRITVVDLAKNIGHHRAMMVGLTYAKAEYVYLTVVDLEEDPENLVPFWQEMQKNEDIDVVYGIEEIKKDQPFIREIFSKNFYNFFNYFSDTKISSNSLVSRLMNRNYVDTLISHPEKEIFIAALWDHIGFNQVGFYAKKTFKGDSSYTLNRKLRMAVDAITSFSSKPLVYIFYMGISMTALTFAVSLFLILKKVAMSDVMLGWTSIMLAIFFVGGIIVFSLGIIGIYLAMIFKEVKARPYQLVKKVYRRSP